MPKTTTTTKRAKAVKVSDGTKNGTRTIYLSDLTEYSKLSEAEAKRFQRAQWAKIERAENNPLCQHCKANADPYDYGEDGSMYFQPDYADVHLKGFAFPIEGEGRGYPLNVKLCGSHVDFQESPDGDYWYDVKEKTKIPFNPIPVKKKKTRRGKKEPK